MSERNAAMDSLLLALRDVGVEEPAFARIEIRTRAALDREVHGRSRRRTSMRSLSRRRVRAAVVVLAATSIAATGYAALTSSSELSSGIDCHVDASLGGSGTIVPVDGRPATATCAALWENGSVGASHNPPAPLHACVGGAGSGAIHVVPAADEKICSKLGLVEDPAAGTGSEAGRYAAFERRLVGWLNTAGCVSDAAVRQQATAALAAADLRGWTIASHGASTGTQSCASVALNSTSRTILIFQQPATKDGAPPRNMTR